MRTVTLHRGGATELAELRRIAGAARRTTALRIALALALAAVLALAALSARSAGSGRAAVLPRGATTGVVALDLSASIAGPVYRRVATTLQGIVAANQSIGLVMFSDVAYELLPPNSPPSALQQFVRFFAPQRVARGAPIFGQSPWSQFSGGTRISTGLVAGLEALRRGRITHGSLVLMSDLNDSESDRNPLVAEATALRQAHVPVRIVPLNATPTNVQLFTRLFGPGAFVGPEAFKKTSKRHVQPIAASSPWALLAVGLVLVGLLAANERLNSRLVPESAV